MATAYSGRSEEDRAYVSSGLMLPKDFEWDGDMTPWVAAALGHDDEFVRFLNMEPGLFRERDTEGHTALHWFSLHNNVSMVRKLLELGSDVEAHSNNGQTPLQWAAIRGNLAVIRVLLAAGADIEAEDSLGSHALHLAIQHGQPLAMMLLLERGASVDVVDNKGCTVAHYAAHTGNLAILGMLQRRGVRLAVKDKEGMTPLHRAVRADQGDVIEFLIKAGNDPLEVDNEGKNAMDICTLAGSPKAAKALSKHNRKERAAKKLLARIGQYFVDPEKRDSWIFGGTWMFAASGTIFVYVGRLAAVTAHLHNTTQAFLASFLLMTAMWLWLTFSDPGFIKDDTPKFPGTAPVSLSGTGGDAGRRTRRVRDGSGQYVEVPVDGPDGEGEGEGEGAVVHAGSGVEEDEHSLVGRLLRESKGINDDERINYICFTCELVKPLRSKHCRHCGYCVGRMDHHCVWIMNCVGEGNHRAFVLYCFVQALVLALFLVLWYDAVYNLWLHSTNYRAFLWTLVGKWKFALAVGALDHLGVYVTSTLAYEQMKHVAQAITTNETINMQRYGHFWEEVVINGRRAKKEVNPFDQGWANNLLSFFGLRPAKRVTYDQLRAQRDRNDKMIADDLNRSVKAHREFGAAGGEDGTVDAKGAGAGGAAVVDVGSNGHGHAHGDDDHGHSHGGHGHSHGH